MSNKINIKGLFFLMCFLCVIGYFTTLKIIKEENNQSEIKFLNDIPEPLYKYNEYIIKEYKNFTLKKAAFLDLDFDSKPELVINYKANKKEYYDVIDVIDNNYYKYENVSDILLIYSSTENAANWYINYSSYDNNINLCNISQTLTEKNNIDISLNESDLMQFKTKNQNLLYDIKFTEISFNNIETNLLKTYEIYEKEDKKIINIINKH